MNKIDLEITPDPETGCWIWPYGNSGGKWAYGIVMLNNKAYRAHRVMYESLIGEIPDGLYLDHLCRNTLCVNPWHLEPVDNKTNIRRGNHTKMTAELVVRLREQVANGQLTLKQASEAYGIDRSYVSAIVKGRRWPDVGGPLSHVGQIKGETHHKSEYSDEFVAEIKSLRGVESKKDVAQKYGLPLPVVTRLWQPTYWKHLEVA